MSLIREIMRVIEDARAEAVVQAVKHTSIKVGQSPVIAKKVNSINMNKHHRKSWDTIWMEFADSISQRSIDDRRKVGAVIVTDDNAQVLALGYNGDQRGGPNTIESNEPGKSGCIHAELNAIIKLDFNSQKRRVMYVTTFPCRDCAKCIVNACIDEVVYRDEYRNNDGASILTDAGIRVRKYS